MGDLLAEKFWKVNACHLLLVVVTIAGCSTTSTPIQRQVTPTVNVVGIGPMRTDMEQDAYWAFCTPRCEPPTPKTRVYPRQPGTLIPGQAVQVHSKDE